MSRNRREQQNACNAHQRPLPAGDAAAARAGSDVAPSWSRWPASGVSTSLARALATPSFTFTHDSARRVLFAT